MKKPLWIMVGITAAFACILLGFFIGRNTGRKTISVNNGTPAGTVSADPNSQESNDGKININTATKRQLMLLSGIGETYAQRIIEYRTANGNFSAIEDIMNVSGIGEKTFEQIKDRIKVN